MSEVEVPTSWFVRGTLLCTALVVFLGWWLFDISPLLGLLAVLMSVLLSIVACRATGETSITPIGALGKITQFMYGGLAAGNIQTNLMTASITAGAAMHSADLLTDLKGGYVLGSKPKSQFISQFCGILAGAIFCIPAYTLLATPERLGSPEFPAPAAKTWQAVAELLAGGVDSKLRGQADAELTSVKALPLDLVPVGTRAGEELVVEEGPNRGTYAILAVVDKAVVLDRAFSSTTPDTKEDVVVVGRGPAKTRGAVKDLPAVLFDRVPEGTQKGDYLRWLRPGRELFWNVKARIGQKLIVDRPLVDPEDTAATPLSGPMAFEIRKESLPPYALSAVVVALLFAIALTLAETYAPKRVRAWLPSTIGIGLGFVVAGFDSISMFLGALLAFTLQKVRPKLAEDYTLAGASGIMAGASLAGILIIVLAQVARVIATP